MTSAMRCLHSHRQATTVRRGSQPASTAILLRSTRPGFARGALKSQPHSLQRCSSTSKVFDEAMVENAASSVDSPILSAAANNSLGFGFSAGGLLFPYFIGVAAALTDLEILTPSTKVAGASAGSIIAACQKSGLSWDAILEACLLLADDCRSKGTRFRLSSVLQNTLERVLPDDIHERCTGTAYMAVTRVSPLLRPELVSVYTSKQDVINSMLTSCHIPWYFDGRLVTPYRGSLYFDGGITNFIPATPSQHCVRVCCFPRSQLAAFGNIAIAPDAYESWPYTMQQMLAWAFEPAPEDMLLSLVEKGRNDAKAWAVANSLATEQAGVFLAVRKLQI